MCSLYGPAAKACRRSKQCFVLALGVGRVSWSLLEAAVSNESKQNGKQCFKVARFRDRLLPAPAAAEPTGSLLLVVLISGAVFEQKAVCTGDRVVV